MSLADLQARILAEKNRGTKVTTQAPHPATLEPHLGPIPRSWVDEVPPPRRFLLRVPEGEANGFIPLGCVGIISAAGGSSKSMSMIQLAVSIVTARPWLGHFLVTPEATGRVLLALAEETREEIWRRVYAVSQTLGLADSEKDALARIDVAPLSGVRVGLLEGGDGLVSETAVLAELRSLVRRDNDPYSLIVLDPLSRWGGGECEGDNTVATHLVEVLESLAQAPGGPTVIIVHHSSKFARRAGQADARGVTALTDGPRFALELRIEKDGAVKLALAKSNYAPPIKGELELRRGPDGVLSVCEGVSAADRDELDRAREERVLNENVEAIVATINRAGGIQGGQEYLAMRAGITPGQSRSAARLAVSEAENRGVILCSGKGRAMRWTLLTSPNPAKPRQTAPQSASREGANGGSNPAAVGAGGTGGERDPRGLRGLAAKVPNLAVDPPIEDGGVFNDEQGGRDDG